MMMHSLAEQKVKSLTARLIGKKSDGPQHLVEKQKGNGYLLLSSIFVIELASTRSCPVPLSGEY